MPLELKGQMKETAETLMEQLGLQRHPEGGYYAETDRREEQVPTPFVDGTPPRALATSIYYLLTPDSPNGFFHTNKEQLGWTETDVPRPPPGTRRVHADHAGGGSWRRTDGGATRGRRGGMRLLIVGTGVWKMSRLLEEDVRMYGDRAGCLITEVVVPGFHWEDHAFLTMEEFRELIGESEELEGLTSGLNTGKSRPGSAGLQHLRTRFNWGQAFSSAVRRISTNFKDVLGLSTSVLGARKSLKTVSGVHSWVVVVWIAALISDGPCNFPIQSLHSTRTPLQ
ncbi:RmlC-like cupin domain-containing protein [Mycena sp. CBHHK59/15]|nr:RmlC-like cupin domain-containing protein [Mycena sp. CBHHK59/15]